jgi:hypothetical protein
MMYALNENGRVGVILPDGFLFGTDNAKVNIKKKLLNEFNLHTIVRLPSGVFAPYTSITTNILFFDKTVPTEDVWYYEHKVGNGGKTYSKTKQLRSEFLIQNATGGTIERIQIQLSKCLKKRLRRTDTIWTSSVHQLFKRFDVTSMK